MKSLKVNILTFNINKTLGLVLCTTVVSVTTRLRVQQFMHLYAILVWVVRRLWRDFGWEL